MADPETGNGFAFELGDGKGAGLRWDKTARREDETWDLEIVRASAHYITPDGTRIDEADRMAIVRAGHWQPTASGAPGRRGYRIVQ